MNDKRAGALQSSFLYILYDDRYFYSVQGYTQMARTLENVFERQMKKHFPDDDNQSSDDDFEEELTESELRKLNKKKTNEMNGMDDLVKAADIHRSSQEKSDPRFANPAIFAQHFG